MKLSKYKRKYQGGDYNEEKIRDGQRETFLRGVYIYISVITQH
jgi:hypothetical protein